MFYVDFIAVPHLLATHKDKCERTHFYRAIN